MTILLNLVKFVVIFWQCLSVYSLGDVSSLMKTQLLFGWEQKAAGLQTQLDSLLTLIDKSLTQIWESSPKEEGTTGMMAGVRDTNC